MDRDSLASRFALNPPARRHDVEAVQSRISFALPKAYLGFLLICNGLRSQGGLALHEIAALPGRNDDYEVPTYLPGYFMIGDDSGGQAVLIDDAGRIFEVGMGVMSTECLELSAHSLEDLLIAKEGLTLGERSS
ncbi:SMI1/KNR4 family protein [Bordetella genomosp. 13]|uniref:SMI1/KNR4 family protein n=1 Tax=Bordetella genomosp. 13 TaxID=463040 RepID=UPI00119E6F18|nr:SMI1/KNR4 family protein [Bordetella genomosp. 13]